MRILSLALLPVLLGSLITLVARRARIPLLIIMVLLFGFGLISLPAYLHLAQQ